MPAAVFLLLVALMRPLAAQESLEQAYELVKPSLVLVATYRAGKLVGTGSGFCVGSTHSRSYFVTNKHVIAGGDSFAIVRQLPRFKESVARVVRRSVSDDLAVLEISVGDVPSVTFASDLPAEGRRIAVAGYPRTQITLAQIGLGLSPSLHAGTVNALPAGGYFIQYDAQTEPGNSGGPLFDADTGVVYGIVVLKLRGSNESNVAIAGTRAQALLRNAHISSVAGPKPDGVIVVNSRALFVPTPAPTPSPEPTPVIATDQCQAAISDVRSAMEDLNGAFNRYVKSYQSTTSAMSSATNRYGMIGAQIGANLEIRAIRSVISAEEPKFVQPQANIEASGAMETARRTNRILNLVHQRDQYSLSSSLQRKALIDNVASGGRGFTLDPSALNESNRLTNQIDADISDFRLSTPCKS